ncbi:MAG: serine hydrolase [Methanospirillum sp.]|nr:serine hydrolase [Methanospirillum sp.]
MHSSLHYTAALILATLFVLSAGWTAAGESNISTPGQTAPAGVSSTGTIVDLQSTAERDAFLADVDTMAEKELKNWDVPGMAVAIVKDGKVVFAKGYGVKQAGGSDPVTADTVFEIGSTSKAFTSALVAMEVDSGRMNWSDKMITYVPDFQMKDPWVTKEFTITDSLAQRSGLPDHWGTELGALGFSRDEMIHALRYVEPASSFRSTYMYQNIPFLVAAAAVEKTSGKSWEENMKERIFVPLNMTSASIGNDSFMASPDRVSLHWSDLRDDGTYGPVVADSSPYMVFATLMGPAGGVNANVRDVAKWVIFQLGNGTYNGTRLVSQESLDYMHTPRTPTVEVMNTSKDYYCQGWFYEEIPGYPPIIWHNGETYGNHAMIILVPSDNLGIVVLSNVAGPSLPDVFAYKVYDRYFGREDPPGMTGAAASYRQQTNVTASNFTATRPDGAAEPLELSAYTGTFRNDVYGSATVAVEDGNLTVTYGKEPTKYYLTPYDGNTFAARCPGYMKSFLYLLNFEAGSDGSIQQMELPLITRPELYSTFVRD